MIDPLQRIATQPDGSGQPSLFEPASKPDQNTPEKATLDTSKKAGEQAARNAGRMRALIVEQLSREPLALFEIAARLSIPDHTISGRLTDLARDGVIERTGQTRIKPETQCQCSVWKLASRTCPNQPGITG
jgi:DNA-binding HxlR family transcriptional regulator